jgi:formate hydrogenlyase transcriptional activator
MGKKIESIPRRAMEVLTDAAWPGNVRELQNFIERAVILTQGSELHVPSTELKNGVRASRTTSASTSISTFQAAERQAIIDALQGASGKIGGTDGAAERLGLKRTTLQNKMRKLKITRADYSAQA